MEKEVFEFTIEDTVTDVGLRLAIASRVPDEIDIRVDNVAEHKVRVYLKGYKESVESFYKYLRKQKLGEAKNHIFSELKPLEAGCIEINTDRFFHKLQCEQLGKFVDVGTAGFEGLGNKVDNLGGKIDSLGDKLDTLPERIAKELKAALK